MNLTSKKLFIKTYGCQMNVYDSLKMQDLLALQGYSITEKMDEANMVVLNTCHVREKASEKVYSELGRIKELKEEKHKNGEEMFVAVAGCVGQAEGEEIFRRAPYVDIVVGPQSYQNLPGLISQVKQNKKNIINLDLSVDDKFDNLPESSMPQGITAYLTIQEGCDKFCKFCSVAYTRGAEYSRPVEEIMREALKITDQGAIEITLLGQNVSAYHGIAPDKSSITMAKLIDHISDIPKIKRIRYTTSHPNDMDDTIIEAHASNPKLMPLLHLPVQSGSDKILHSMNRKYNVKQYLDLINRFKKSNPAMQFSSDFIVGYPGETEEDFEQTLELIRQVNFIMCYSFTYSIRPGTPAALMKNQIPEEVKNARLKKLLELTNKLQSDFNKSFMDKTIPVLFEKPGRFPGQVLGKSEYSQSVHAIGTTDMIGKILDVKIIDIKQNSLEGIII